ncbi:MAG TPA: DUF2304 domain-containing protein [Candidatus Limicola stercorigallinarum]|nr:DUF2304 domain-containing protein [Candidatus Limicola stercorigallinarum]
MLFAVQAVSVVFCVLLLLFIVRLVARERLQLKYSLLWLMLGILLLAAALFPDTIFALSERLGFETPSNFIFFVGLFCLLAIALSLSVIVSKQALMIKNLTQRLALVDYELRELRSKRPQG